MPVLEVYYNFRNRKFYSQNKGDNFYCPICKSSFKNFAPYGAGNRPNACCLKCGSVERHRLLYMFMLEKTDLFNTDTPKRLLHFAPERVFYNLFVKQKHIKYVPGDLFPKSYTSRGMHKVKKIDMCAIPFPDNYFDAIINIHVLEHIPDDIGAMKELYRVMKPGSWGIFHVPIDDTREKTYEDFSITDPAEREKIFGQHDHVRIYGLDYKDRLASAGFLVTVDNYVKSFTNEELSKLSIHKNEIVYFCQK